MIKRLFNKAITHALNENQHIIDIFELAKDYNCKCTYTPSMYEYAIKVVKICNRLNTDKRYFKNTYRRLKRLCTFNCVVCSTRTQCFIDFISELAEK